MLALVVRSAVRIYAVPSTSMAPALRPGDRIVVTRFFTDSPARGDVIVFRHPVNGAMTVKRVIAIPGDLVESRGGHAQVVPSQHLFVMGDNRADSHDSRHWGPLPERLVIGRARLVLWRFKWIE